MIQVQGAKRSPSSLPVGVSRGSGSGEDGAWGLGNSRGSAGARAGSSSPGTKGWQRNPLGSDSGFATRGWQRVGSCGGHLPGGGCWQPCWQARDKGCTGGAAVTSLPSCQAFGPLPGSCYCSLTLVSCVSSGASVQGSAEPQRGLDFGLLHERGEARVGWVMVITRCGAEPQRRLMVGQEPSVIAKERERAMGWLLGAAP